MCVKCCCTEPDPYLTLLADHTELKQTIPNQAHSYLLSLSVCDSFPSASLNCKLLCSLVRPRSLPTWLHGSWEYICENHALNLSVKYFVKDYTIRNKRWCFGDSGRLWANERHRKHPSNSLASKGQGNNLFPFPSVLSDFSDVFPDTQRKIQISMKS